jgi:hypothetical protein
MHQQSRSAFSGIRSAVVALATLGSIGCGGPMDVPAGEAPESAPDEGTVTAAALCSSAPSGANCNGKDPVAQGCNDAYAVDTELIEDHWDVVVGRVVLRYSPKCRSVWARTHVEAAFMPSTYQVTASLDDSQGLAGSTSTIDLSQVPVNSPMRYVGAGNSFKARGAITSTSAYVFEDDTGFVWVP